MGRMHQLVQGVSAASLQRLFPEVRARTTNAAARAAPQAGHTDILLAPSAQRAEAYGPVVSPLVVLVPSPLLGPAVWEPVEQALRRQQWPTLVVKTPDPFRAAADVLAGLLAAVPADQDVVVVAHSNAGAYLPSLVTRRRVVAAVFVDAILPKAAGGPVPLAPPAFLDFLRGKADADEMLPPWTTWWDDADVAPLFPDAVTRARVEQQQPRLPLSYFEGSLPAAPGWDTAPMAYLAFGTTYAAERADAEHRGWPTTTLPGGHLHMLIDPTQVALEITALLRQLGAYHGSTS